MKKTLIAILACGMTATAAKAQYSFDVLQYSQSELRGTSRYQSMAGSMGALGGDVSAINDNPGGIGVYRSSDVNITGGVDFNSSEVFQTKFNKTRPALNQVGYVGTMKLNSDVMPYFNWGLSYNRKYSARRGYAGSIIAIPTSITNYYADWATASDVPYTDLSNNSYYSSTGAQWNQILSYQNNLMIETSDGYSGLGVDGTRGTAEFEVQEYGHTDEYNVTFGGNINNKVYWGIGFGYTEMEYKAMRYYGETLTNTVVYTDRNANAIADGNAAFGYVDGMRTTGEGYNMKFGVIVKPTNELRLGLAFHTPTFYDMKDRYTTTVSAEFAPQGYSNYTMEDQTPNGTVWYTIRTPWRFMGSMGIVAGKKGLINIDYEATPYGTMRIGDEHQHTYDDATDEIKSYMTTSHTVRVGGEYRLTSEVSLRAGYSYQSSPVKQDVKDDTADVITSGSSPAYSYNDNVQYVTAGLGYKYKAFYADLAYVYKMRNNVYRAVPANYAYPNDALPSIGADVKDRNHRVSLTLGVRF